ncbi:MAG: asparagine synthase (glutamine-hydrolyzing) [Cyanobacteria bacterium P01_H01_bin.15]
MCGIVALFSNREPVSFQSLRLAVDSLEHRGPDGKGFFVSPDNKVALGHTRLSIIDIDGGEQPISNQEETLHITANGEFYDFERIQGDLRRWGYKFKTNSDSEIALYLYDQFGTHSLEYLRGEFAFIIWDERNDLLFAARDRFGIKPLYYSNYQNTIYIASEIKALLAAGVPASWDEEAFWQNEFGLLSRDRTMFSNIFQVPPGHFLIASDAGIKLQSYWDFNYPIVNDVSSNITASDYIEQLNHTLSEAIRLRLRADVPVGFYLSGGLDSAAVLGMAKQYLADPIQTFTLAFDHEAYDEESLARETATYNECSLNVISVTQSDLAENFANSIWHGETLWVNGSATARYLLSGFARKCGYKVVLTGGGADEILGGYVHFRQDLLRQELQNKGDSELKNLLEDLKSKNKVSVDLLFAEDNSDRHLKTIHHLLGFVPSWIQAWSKGYFKSFPLYSQEFIDRFSGKDVYRIFFNQIDVQGQLLDRERVNQSLYLWSKSIFPNSLLRILGDGAEMANAIEARLPFLDHKVVELVRNIPVSLKIRGMTEKYILREAAKSLIPEPIYKRQKHPFLAPPSTSMPNEPFQELVQDTLRSSKMSGIPFYNHKSIVHLLDQLPGMDEPQSNSVDVVLMKILSAYFLQEKFNLAQSNT